MSKFRHFGLVTVIIVGVWATANRADPPAKSPNIQYARDIQPILATHCFTCHGPDRKLRKAGLRLDDGTESRKILKSGSRAIVPGDAKASELITRINAAGDDAMPPPGKHQPLRERDRQLLKRWIEEGAEYQAHWAFVAPKRPPLPGIENAAWPRNSIDHFVLARLEKEGLAPSPEADRHTLARRVALDLTGLPPSIAQVDRFIQDTRPDAYERYVDEILAQPGYGERWAQVWLDLARYADSNGYATDNARTIWLYRDWVINAINANLPFDQFTVEQIAGDMLPKATPSQIVATGFHRNTLTNDEGGTDDEEFRNVAVVDRVNTTMQVWMGLTMSCAQCHDHKYDPFSQEEYFRLFAIFNQTEDSDKSDNRPLHSAISAEKLAVKRQLEGALALAEKKYDERDPKIEHAFADWVRAVKPDKLPAKLKTILAVPAEKRTTKQEDELFKHFRTIAPEWKGLREEIASLKKQVAAVQPVTTPVMKELPDKQRRVTKIHIRGNHLNLGKVVEPGLPAALPPLPSDAKANRLALARWLVAPDNPLTARVTVNRYWEQLFGAGLVETPEDFGIRSKLPTHPELLDWLAVEFVEGEQWDVKKLLKLIVTSAAHRQSARVTPELAERDPHNHLFARGPRQRATAETIRDQALALAGLLSPKMYGPPVRPPQPRLGLTAAFGGGTDWTDSTGDDKYRRALYTQWRRTTPYPSMTTFDAPSRNVCTVSRPRTNTPLQALVTLNDPVYVEAAQALGRRLVREGGTTTQSRIEYGFRLCLSRPPREAETARLVSLFEQLKKKYAGKPKEALQMATEPLGPLAPGMDAAELASYTVVANVLLNLDEVLAKR